MKKSRYLILILTLSLLLLSACRSGSPTPTSTLHTELSTDIGAHFDKNFVQLQYVSFTPVITRDEAIAIAKNDFQTGFHLNTDNLTIDATVALFSGHPDLPKLDTTIVLSKVPVWIVVIKNLPLMSSVGPPPVNPKETLIATGSSQYNLAIDANTGKIIYGVLSSDIQRTIIP